MRWAVLEVQDDNTVYPLGTVPGIGDGLISVAGWRFYAFTRADSALSPALASSSRSPLSASPREDDLSDDGLEIGEQALLEDDPLHDNGALNGGFVQSFAYILSNSKQRQLLIQAQTEIPTADLRFPLPLFSLQPRPEQLPLSLSNAKRNETLRYT
jgi:hypothetical protein